MPRDDCRLSPSWTRAFEWTVQGLIFYGILSYYLEVEWNVDVPDHVFWIWNERLIAALFTAEFIYRWHAAPDRRRYLWQPMAIVDLLAILPFYMTFLVDLRSLRLIRTLRVLRLLKLYRYSIALQHVFHGFRRVRHELTVVGFVILVMVTFSAATIFEFEHDVQPEKFARLSDAIWWSFATLTTVGYGDLVPITLGGRLVAMVTMLVGIGIFGIFISLIGSSFLTTMREQSTPIGVATGALPGVASRHAPASVETDTDLAAAA